MPPISPDLKALTANDQQIAFASTGIVHDGPAVGQRVLTIHPAAGVHARVLLDRAMDIGAAWVRGVPVAWISAAGERGGGTDDHEAWNDVWAGGLLTTCGLRNVGSPSDGYGHHGHVTDAHAESVNVRHEGGAVVVTGTMREPEGFGRGLVLERTQRWSIGIPRLEVIDIVRNESPRRQQAPLLYHINLGHPFLAPDTITSGHFARSTRLFADSPTGFPPEMGEPEEGRSEVFEHVADGVRVESPATGIALQLTWTRDTLPRFYTWRLRRPGSYVQGLEPANCGQFGRQRDREEGRAPYLDPGEERTTGVTFDFEQLERQEEKS